MHSIGIGKIEDFFVQWKRFGRLSPADLLLPADKPDRDEIHGISLILFKSSTRP